MKCISLFFLALLLVFSFPLQGNPGQSMKVIQDKTKVPILTPSLKDRETKKLELENGMKVYLVHEPSAKQSGAALSVEVGGWSDPDKRPGMAHFLEHMLFLGNEKYPQEAEYRKYLDEHGGYSNAFTAFQNTTYMFAVDNNAFEGALDRFSQFFISPTFTDAATDRERNAVDQEFKRLKENDGWREHFVTSNVINQKHPYSRFHVGNLETLNNISRDELIEWYHEHYSANLMYLVIYSPLPMNTLEKLALEDFSKVKNTGKERNVVKEPLFGESTTSTITYIDPVAEIRSVDLTWEIPVAYTSLENKTNNILGHLIGHEGHGSLLAELKNSGLATGLSAGGSKVGKEQALFSIRVNLTKKGLEKLPEVIETCFEGIEVFKTNLLPTYLFEELQATALQNYQYQSKGDTFNTVRGHAVGLLHEDMATYPERSSLYLSFSPEELHSLLDLLSPTKTTITVTAPEKEVDPKLEKKEKWSGAAYHTGPIPSSLMERIKHPNITGRIIVPAKNPFVADKLTLNNPDAKPETLTPVPTLLEDSDYAKVYYCEDDRYQVPDVVWYFHIKSGEIEYGDAESEVLRDLYTYAAREELKKLTYPASLASLQFSVGAGSPDGLTIKITGASPKASYLLTEVTKKLKTIKPSVEQFLVYKEQLQRNYENASKEDPVNQARRMLSEYLIQGRVNPEEKIKVLEKTHWKHLNTFSKNIYDKVYIEALLYGNANKDHASLAWTHFKNEIGGKPYPEGKSFKLKTLNIDEKKAPLFITKKTDLKRNAVALAVQEGPFSFKNRAAQQILSGSIEGYFFDTLRTKQQTAYVVYNYPTDLERELTEFFAIESSTHSTRDLLARFELAFEEYLKNLEEEVDQERFENTKLALLQKFEKPPENIYDMGALLNELAFSYEGDFQWMEKRAKGFKDLSYAEFLELSHQFLGRGNKSRLAILLNGKLPKAHSFDYKSAQSKKPLGTYQSKEERFKQ